MATLQLEKVTKSFGTVDVIKGVDLDVADGELIVFVGPSGCGKSTLLRIIAGLEDATSGTIRIDGDACNDKAPKQRGIAMVFQSYALYPHKTVYQNMAFSLKLSKRPKAEIDARIREAARILQMEHLLERRPHQLSGGQRQRVAIGRAIVRHPKVFLFDEPLSNLDAALRVSMRREIARLHADLKSTMIYVTHDQVEAMTLADRIVVLAGGYIEQVGPPMQLYDRPANLFVAQFIGSPAMNIIPATIETTGSSAVVALAGGKSVDTGIPVADSEKGKKASFGVRPEDLVISSGDDFLFEGTVSIVEALGEVTLLYVEGLTEDEPIIAKLPGHQKIDRGDKVRFKADTAKLHLFDASGITLKPKTR